MQSTLDRAKSSAGFTLFDLLATVCVMGIISAIAAPVYTEFVERSRQVQAVTDLGTLEMAIEVFAADNFSLPDSLDELGAVPRTDPWGNAYSYLRIEGSNVQGIKGKQRKDKNLNPLNSDFDLYSNGMDGKTKAPLTAKDSHDDVIRAGNGGFIGIASEH